MSSSSKKNLSKQTSTVPEDRVRPSISIRMIRHAESGNNEVYRNARYIYRGGTPDFDEAGWVNYVQTHRCADPALSEIGQRQSTALAQFLVPHLLNQASRPVQIITSPMRRTLETIRPTLQQMHAATGSASKDDDGSNLTHVMVHGFYFESEGCHTKNVPEEGMTPAQITELLQQQQQPTQTLEDEQQQTGTTNNNKAYPSNIEFVGFPDPNRGWYCNATSEETRVESETRAAKFYMWLCDTLDQQLSMPADDVFDAGVAMEGEEGEIESDKSAPRKRRRRTTLLIGHGDFMSLVLKRIMAGFGHAVEREGIPHRSAFIHYNTGITELEYFGRGRFLLMGHNQTPHIAPAEYGELLSGGSLKDGWTYLLPDEEFILDAEVDVGFEDELEDHVREQTDALKALYLPSESTNQLHADKQLSVEQEEDEQQQQQKPKHFVVKQGYKVVAVATYSDVTGKLFDVAIRPSAGKEVSATLFTAVKEYAKKMGRSGSILIESTRAGCTSHAALIESIGFQEVDNEKEAD